MASPSELSLDCKPYTYSMLLKSFGDLHQSDQTQKLEEVLSCLEEERLKIDAFKRELPLCMQLLSDAVETSRQQLQAYRSNQGSAARPVLEEFIPLKTSPNSDQTSDKIITNPNSDKANWMTTAQLWSQDSIIVHETKPQSTPSANNNNNCIQKVGSLDTKLQRNGGAFLPFSKERNLCSNNSTPSPNPTLALASSDHKESLMILEDKNHHKVIQCSDQSTDHHHHQMNGFSCPKRDSSSCKVEQGGNGGGNNSSSDGQVGNGTTSSASTNPNSQAHRKARRCWSPDLHRRFVNALQMLGGSQVATPKQIRELMKVDGLTNDEVKSHLQKYRLHTRRPSPSPQAAGAQAPQLVVLGGIWVPPEYATAAAHNGSTAALYGTHHHQVHHPATNSHAPPHFCGGASPQQLQEFYTTGASAAQMPPLPPSHHHQMLLHHHQLQMYKPTSQQQPHSPPGSDMRGTAERSESIEDGKSESGSWKGESGDNGGERKGLAALREDGEESNGSEITLKFKDFRDINN